jgi:hypothetical protein
MQDPDVWVIELIVAQDERSVLNQHESAGLRLTPRSRSSWGCSYMRRRCDQAEKPIELARRRGQTA